MQSMLNKTHVHQVQIYYEDTDHSGAVYHANYLRYLERGREHMFGIDELVALQRDQGIGFVVYKVAMTFRAPAFFGNTLEIISTARRESDYRLVVDQKVVRPADNVRLMEGTVELACTNSGGKLVGLPF